MSRWFFRGLIFVVTIQLAASDARKDSGVDSKSPREQLVLKIRKRSFSDGGGNHTTERLRDEQRYEALKRAHTELCEKHEKQEEKNTILEALISALRAQSEQLRSSLEATRTLLQVERIQDRFFTEAMMAMLHAPAGDLDDGIVPSGGHGSD